MIKSVFKTIVRKDREDFATILNGQLFTSPVPFAFPSSVENNMFIDLLIDEDKENFDENYEIIEIKVVPLEN